ncbi:DedA family protein [Methanobacterium alcaliphilum]|uniref:DedA family protein n=1 Tax=Methanobacterium alcaliphilum TaxID=392018 RepID=UPI00200B148D|nr:VTT domain-containing protein [Methanobacterium alcaliphilum]MCK9150505.1 VTT domain-containing protein [Methanobacterium alcaliphilum]
MISELITFAGNIIIEYGALGVFLASILEEVVAPIPSSVVVLSSSFFLMNNHTLTLASLERLFLMVALPAAIGVTLGSLFSYGITYFAGKPFVDSWGKYLGLSWKDVEKLDKRFDKSHTDEFLLFALRFIPITPSVVVNAFCGFIRYDLKKFLIITFLGTLARVFMLGFVGWQFGNFYNYLSQQISILETITIAAVFVGIIIYLVYVFNKKRD